jgi:uncharacterized protein (DUF2062 family)
MIPYILGGIMFKIPTKDLLIQSRWLKWMGPTIAHPSLWRWQRHPVSMGVCVGLFFGMLIPIAQIPLSAIFAVIFRANVSVAALSTLVSNPFTFPGIYYCAYLFGDYILGTTATLIELTVVSEDVIKQSTGLIDTLLSTGKPVALGLACFAVFFSIAGYFLTSLIWNIRTRIRWGKRKRRVKSGR